MVTCAASGGKTCFVTRQPVLCEEVVRESHVLEQAVAVRALCTREKPSCVVQWNESPRLRTLTAPMTSSSPVPSPGRYSFSWGMGGLVRRSSGTIALASRETLVRPCSSLWNSALSHLRKRAVNGCPTRHTRSRSSRSIAEDEEPLHCCDLCVASLGFPLAIQRHTCEDWTRSEVARVQRKARTDGQGGSSTSGCPRTSGSCLAGLKKQPSTTVD